MYVDYSAPKLIATWNPARGAWEKDEPNLLCEHLELFSETWPSSGMTRGGQAYELPTPVHLIIDLGSSSSHIPEDSMLRTPSVTDSTGGAISENQARERGRMVKTADQVAQLAFENGLKVSPSITAQLLPTPNTMDMLPARTPEKIAESKERTPQVDDAKNTGHNQDRRSTLASEVWETERTTAWGKFEPAIRRWEQVIGRPAPAPTKDDGKDGAHRLSSSFTEWMMGLPDGWITDVGLTRNGELKACGNGVVPQQAALALNILLDGINLN
jgi:hypothetical protein